MADFMQQHPVWSIVVFVAGFYLIGGLIVWIIKDIVRSVVLEMVNIKYLESKWAWEKYHRTERLRRIALGSLYTPSEPPPE